MVQLNKNIIFFWNQQFHLFIYIPKYASLNPKIGSLEMLPLVKEAKPNLRTQLYKKKDLIKKKKGSFHPLLSNNCHQLSRISPSSIDERDEFSLSEFSADSLASEGVGHKQKTDKQLVSAMLFAHQTEAVSCLLFLLITRSSKTATS